MTGKRDVELWDDLVIPLRHPEKVAMSWSKRAHRKGPSAWKQWRPSWRELGTYPGHFFIIDGDRGKELRLLSDFVGVALKTDWEPINASEGEAKQIIPPEDIAFATSIYETIVARHDARQ